MPLGDTHLIDTVVFYANFFFFFKFADRRLTGMAWIYDFLPSRRFPDICLNVYFSDNYSEYDYITMNGGLYSLFTDYAAQVSANERKEYLDYAK